MLTEDEFGLLEPSVKAPAPTPEDRLVGAYEEILEFTRQHGRPPAKDPTNIAEFKLAMRLEAMCADDNQRQQLEPVDELGLLNEPEPPATIDDAIADDPFDLLSSHDDLFDLQHVPKKQTMPDKVARREPAKDFEAFRQLFVDCHADLRAGRRKLLAFKNPSEIEQGKFFVLNGVLLYVANVGEAEFAKSNKGNNARTRCIFENGTESDLLLLSLGRNLYKDGRRVTEPNEVTLERMGLQADTKMGYVYVLRSLSDDPQLDCSPASTRSASPRGQSRTGSPAQRLMPRFSVRQSRRSPGTRCPRSLRSKLRLCCTTFSARAPRHLVRARGQAGLRGKRVVRRAARHDR